MEAVYSLYTILEGIGFKLDFILLNVLHSLGPRRAMRGRPFEVHQTFRPTVLYL